MWLIAGLGNPGRKYQGNRHNVGFRAIDELARRHVPGEFRSRFGAEYTSGQLTAGGRPHRVLLIKPMEFMNRSGLAVVRFARFYDLAAEDMVVIHDEIDIDFGRLKLKSGGGHGGHNGLRSIIAELGSPGFARVRVGVGKPGPPPGSEAEAPPASSRDRRVSGHVLSDFPSSMHAEVERLIDTAADAAEAIVGHGIREAMNEFHKPEPKPDPKPEPDRV